jgi:hypothetical protein
MANLDLGYLRNIKLGPINCLGLAPDVPRYIMPTASKVPNQGRVVGPNIIDQFNLGEQNLKFRADVAVVHSCGTLTCVLNGDSPALKGNGLDVLEASCMQDDPHLVHSGESCPGKISRLIFGVLAFLRLKSWCLTFLAGIYSLRRIKLAGTNFLMPKVSRKAFLPL